MSFQLFCEECGKEYDNYSYRLFCDKCRGLIEVRYDAPPLEMFLGRSPKQRGMKRFLARLPIKDQKNFVSMGEGDTPIIPLPRISEKLGLRNVQAKLEYFNPTGSLKDRGNTHRWSNNVDKDGDTLCAKPRSRKLDSFTYQRYRFERVGVKGWMSGNNIYRPVKPRR